jgi:hypothetical protein
LNAPDCQLADAGVGRSAAVAGDCIAAAKESVENIVNVPAAIQNDLRIAT